MDKRPKGKSPFIESEPRHQCFIYAGPPSRQLPALAAMIQRKLKEGYRCLYLNSRPMVAGIRSRLSAIGIDVAYEMAKGRLILSSEPVTSPNGSFDIDSMLHKLEDALDQALSDGYKGLWATGDMTWEFGSEKNLVKLEEYERGLEDILRRRPELCGICQYHQDTLPGKTTRQAFLTHPMLFINDTLLRINPYYAPAAQSNDQKAAQPELNEMLATLYRLQDTQS